MDMATAIALTIVTAATPLLLAAIGELVVERTGVLNLGVEGMMIVGAATAFAVAVETDSSGLGVLAGMGAAMLLSLLFALMVLVLAANQVASGLALTILGVGASGLIGEGFVGQQRAAMAPLSVPWLSDLPVVGRLIFGQDALVYASLALVVGVAYVLQRTRLGLEMRAAGEDHNAAHALGLPVRRIRLGAIVFGGACAGLAGAYLSLVYTPFWASGMTAGRGWIALALVVFSGWHPARALLGAYLFGTVMVGQLHLQAMRGSLPEMLALPGQFWSALPYLATILALVAISRRGGVGGGTAPGSLGVPFVPDR